MKIIDAAQQVRVERSSYVGRLFNNSGYTTLGALRSALDQIRALGFSDAAEIYSSGNVKETVADTNLSWS